MKLPVTFSIALSTSPHWLPSGLSSKHSSASRPPKWLDDYALYAVLRRVFNTARGPNGPSRYAAAMRRRSPRPPPITRASA